jgi:hypothetical protein
MFHVMLLEQGLRVGKMAWRKQIEEVNRQVLRLRILGV